MAQIIRSTDLLINPMAISEATTFATNYWGALAQEKMFPIPFWQVRQMLGVSGSNEIALRVVNIDDPSAVSASWIVFEQLLADTLRDPVEPGVYYFILDDTFFHGPVLVSAANTVVQVDGIYQASGTPENNIIRGRLGQDDDGNFFAFFQAAQCVLIDPGAGGSGALSGIKVPSNQ